MVAAPARVSEVKAECFLRGACAAVAAAAALLVGLSTQTETVLLVRKKATVKDVQALWYPQQHPLSSPILPAVSRGVSCRVAGERRASERASTYVWGAGG